MTLKEALETLADYYNAESDGRSVTGLATIHGPISHEVWLAWEIVLRKIGRIKSTDKPRGEVPNENTPERDDV